LTTERGEEAIRSSVVIILFLSNQQLNQGEQGRAGQRKFMEESRVRKPMTCGKL